MKKKTAELYIYLPFVEVMDAHHKSRIMVADDVQKEAYVNALIREISDYKEDACDYSIKSVYLAGGDVATLPASLLDKLMQTLNDTFTISNTCEVLAECSVEKLTPAKEKQLRDSGINKLTLPMVSANADELKAMKAAHSVNKLQKAPTYFDDYGYEIFVGLPKQTPVSLRKTLRKVVGLEPSRISVIPYTQMSDMTMAQRAKLLHMAEEYLISRNYIHYGANEYALADKECVHFVEQANGIDYISFGMGTVSMVEEMVYETVSDIAIYCDETSSWEQIYPLLGKVDEAYKMKNYILSNLLYAKHFSVKALNKHVGKEIETRYQTILDDAVKKAWLSEKSGVYTLTDMGILMLSQFTKQFQTVDEPVAEETKEKTSIKKKTTRAKTTDVIEAEVVERPKAVKKSVVKKEKVADKKVAEKKTAKKSVKA